MPTVLRLCFAHVNHAIVDACRHACYADVMPKAPTAKDETYDATVMIRITKEFRDRLDTTAVALATQERAFGRARKVGRATVVYEAMRIGLPLLEKSLTEEEE